MGGRLRREGESSGCVGTHLGGGQGHGAPPAALLCAGAQPCLLTTACPRAPDLNVLDSQVLVCNVMTVKLGGSCSGTRGCDRRDRGKQEV